MDRSERLGQEKISKLLLQFSIPAIIGMLVNGLYNVIDRIFIGKSVGALGLAGVTVGFPVMIILMAVGMLIGMGATSLIAIKLGEQKKDEAELVVGNALLLLVLTTAVFSVLGLVFVDPMLRLFGASDVVLPYAREFIQIILVGSVFMAVSFGMNNFIRSEGNPKMAMLTMIIGAVLNTILNYILVYRLNWGLKGSALSTVIAQGVSAAWVLYYFLFGKSLLKIHTKNFRINGEIARRIFAIGLAPFLMQFAASFITVLMNKSLSHYGGDIAIAAVGVINTLVMILVMPVIGINQGAQPIIGYNYGAEKFDRVKKTLKLAIAYATGIISIGFFAAMIFPHQLISLFERNNTELIEFGAHALRIFFIFLPIVAFQIVGASYFQAVGKPKQAMILMLSRQVLLLIPLLLILPRFYGLNGILYSGPIADLLSAIITAVWLFAELSHLQKKHEEGQIEA